MSTRHVCDACGKQMHPDQVPFVVEQRQPAVVRTWGDLEDETQDFCSLRCLAEWAATRLNPDTQP